MVDISGIDKVTLLRALWDHSSPASFFSATGSRPPAFNDHAAPEAVRRYIDYFQGRCIKTDISGDTADPRLYDRDMGAGTFAKIVAQLK